MSKAVGSHVEFELLKVMLHSGPLKTLWADMGHHGEQLTQISRSGELEGAS